MPRRPRENRLLLTDIELELMRCIWDKGTASASAVQMQMVRDGKETAYTTVKTMLDRLVRAGVCTAKETKGRYYYAAKISQAEIAKEWLRHLNEKLYRRKSKASKVDSQGI
ncbi:BlaI/MecI/CopY family transcriptional regulator [bacterium]|nr:BlaI/MecI/CopY family transcriptional regulator [bacterium]